MAKATQRPIFVIGSGRSGTTLLLDVLAGHPDLAWVSPMSDLTGIPALAAFSRSSLLRRFRPFQPASESVRTYRRVGLDSIEVADKRRALDASDLSKSTAHRLEAVMASHRRWMGRPRFVSKNTVNTMRARLLHAALPGARFVHIFRNGYAVAASLRAAPFWPDLRVWWLGTTPTRWQEQHPHEHPLALCAAHWHRQVTEALSARDELPRSAWLDVRYEDLTTDPHTTMSAVLSFCELGDAGALRRHVDGLGIDPGRGSAWRRRIDEGGIAAVNREAGPLLDRLGYARLTSGS